MADYYKPGDWNVICDRTGFKKKRAECRKEWTGSTVRRKSWEPRHEQDLIRSFPDDQSVPDPRPPAEHYFLATNEVEFNA